MLSHSHNHGGVVPASVQERLGIDPTNRDSQFPAEELLKTIRASLPDNLQPSFCNEAVVGFTHGGEPVVQFEMVEPSAPDFVDANLIPSPKLLKLHGEGLRAGAEHEVAALGTVVNVSDEERSRVCESVGYPVKVILKPDSLNYTEGVQIVYLIEDPHIIPGLVMNLIDTWREEQRAQRTAPADDIDLNGDEADLIAKMKLRNSRPTSELIAGLESSEHEGRFSFLRLALDEFLTDHLRTEHGIVLLDTERPKIIALREIPTERDTFEIILDTSTRQDTRSETIALKVHLKDHQLSISRLNKAGLS